MGKKSRQKRERKKQGKRLTPTTDVSPEKVNAVRKDQENYSSNWHRSAQKFVDNGGYIWMSSFLRNHGQVLEIGTGDGSGTLQLLRDGHTVIGVELNWACLNATEDLLRSQGFEVTHELRGVVRDTNLWPHVIEYRTPQVEVQAGSAVLLESDILNDFRLIEWLKRTGPLDAVACWLIGVHGLRTLGFGNEPNLQRPDQYRMMVQSRVYELADQVLRPGGILHVVDRGQMLRDERLLEEELAAQRDLASVTSLVVEKIECRPIDSMDVEDGVKMGLSPGTSGRIPERVELALQSILLRKP